MLCCIVLYCVVFLLSCNPLPPSKAPPPLPIFLPSMATHPRSCFCPSTDTNTLLLPVGQRLDIPPCPKVNISYAGCPYGLANQCREDYECSSNMRCCGNKCGRRMCVDTAEKTIKPAGRYTGFKGLASQPFLVCKPVSLAFAASLNQGSPAF